MFKQKLNKHSTPFYQNRKLLLPLAFIGLFFFNLSSTLFAQGSGACEGIKVNGVFNEDPNSDYFQGITIQNLDAPIQIIKIYNSNWERIEECSGDCTSLSAYETEVGKYFVQIQLYNDDWEWICQTDNIEVIVPSGPTTPPSECGLDIISADFPSSAKPGETINLQATVRNSATVDVVNSSVGLYQLSGGNKSYPEPKLIAETPIDFLAVGESKTLYFSATLPNPLWNVPVYPIGDESVSNNFILLTKENLNAFDANKCKFPADFRVDYPDVDLALSLENNQGCIDSEGFLLTDLKVTNLSNRTAKAPIYVDLAQDCSFGNAAVVTCKVHASALRAYYIINQDLAPNQSIIIEKPYQLPNTAITEWDITAYIDALGSALDDPDFDNNTVKASFIKTANCGGTNPTPDCKNITAIGNSAETIQGGAPSGIFIDGTNAGNTIIKIYNSNWELVKECTTCPLPYFEGFPPGDYIVQVKLFDENWKWICQTDNIEVNVPSEVGVNCQEVIVSGIATVDFQGINVSIPLALLTDEIRIFDANHQLISECRNCQEPYVYATTAGTYFVEVSRYNVPKIFLEPAYLVCKTNKIKVKVEEVQTCTAVFFRDADRDGFGDEFNTVSGCSPPVGYVNNFDDCDDTNATIGAKQTQGTTCDDGDATTINDVIQADGCTCKGIPDTGPPSCEDVSIVKVESFAPTPGKASYMVSRLTAPIEIVKIFNRRTYEKLYECNNDCGEGFDIELQEGEYVLQIQMYTASWGWICGKDIEFDMTTTDPPSCDFLTRVRLGELCDECVSEVAVYLFEGKTYYAFLADNLNCSDAQTIVYSCSNGNQFCVDGGIIGSTECAAFFDAAQKIETVWKKSDNCDNCICTQEVDPVCGASGISYGNPCLAECAGVFSWTRGECPTSEPDCSKVTAKFQQGLQDTYEGLGIEGLNAPIEIVKIYDANWNRVYECSGNCENPTVLPLSDLSPGLYRVHVQMYDEDWQWICETDFLEVTVPENAGSRTGGAFIDEKDITLFS